MKTRVIVIDDEESIRDTFKWYLEDLGYEVVTAPEPALCDIYAGKCCQTEHACTDILIVDYNMPRMNGLEFLEMMDKRGCKGVTHNKMILSGNTTQIDKERARKIGCEIRQKPLNLDKLAEWSNEREKTVQADRKLADMRN